MIAAERAPWSVNVTVHGVGTPPRALEDDETGVWISVEQLDGLLDAAVGRPEVVITFDDGNRSDLELGLPRVLERGLTARFFVCAGLLGEPGRLDESDVRELHRSGMMIGSHGWSHRDWRSLDWGTEGSADVECELVHAPRRLADVIGVPVTEVAVPFGSYDRHVVRALHRSGATRVYTSDGGWARRGTWLQPRTSIHRSDGPDWPHRVMTTRPPFNRRARGRVLGVAKRLRG